MRHFLQLAMLLGGVVLLGFPTGKTAAHGGGLLQIADAPLGPYRVSIWTNPPVPRAGEPFHVTTAVYRREGRQDIPVTAAHVALTLTHETGRMVRAEAWRMDAYPYTYEWDGTLDQPGIWTVTVTIDAEGHTGTFTFTVQAQSPSRLPGILWVAVVGVLVGSLIWVLDRLHRYRGV